MAQPPSPHAITGSLSLSGNLPSSSGRKRTWPGEANAGSDFTLYGPGIAFGAPSSGSVVLTRSAAPGPGAWANDTEDARTNAIASADFMGASLTEVSDAIRLATLRSGNQLPHVRRDRLRAGAVRVTKHHEHLSQIRIELELIRGPRQRTAMARRPDAVDEAGFDAVAIASTVVRVDNATRHAARHLGAPEAIADERRPRSCVEKTSAGPVRVRNAGRTRCFGLGRQRHAAAGSPTITPIAIEWAAMSTVASAPVG